MTTRTNHLTLLDGLEHTKGWNVLTNEEMERIKKLYEGEKHENRKNSESA